MHFNLQLTYTVQCNRACIWASRSIIMCCKFCWWRSTNYSHTYHESILQWPSHPIPRKACSRDFPLLTTLASCWNKENLDVMRKKIEESEKDGSLWESNPGHLPCAASALPLSSMTTRQPPALNVLGHLIRKVYIICQHSSCCSEAPKWC